MPTYLVFVNVSKIHEVFAPSPAEAENMVKTQYEDSTDEVEIVDVTEVED